MNIPPWSPFLQCWCRRQTKSKVKIKTKYKLLNLFCNNARCSALITIQNSGVSEDKTQQPIEFSINISRANMYLQKKTLITSFIHFFFYCYLLFLMSYIKSKACFIHNRLIFKLCFFPAQLFPQVTGNQEFLLCSPAKSTQVG